MALYDEKAIQVLKAQTTQKMNAAVALEIKSPEDLEKGKDILNKIAQYKKAVKAQKDKILKPMNEAVKEVRNFFAPIEERVDQADQEIRGKILSYNRVVQEKQAKEQVKIEEKVAAGTMKQETAEKKLEKQAEQVAAIPTRKVAKLVITDEQAIPDEYWVIDMVKLRKAVISDRVAVPGTKVEMEETIVAGR